MSFLPNWRIEDLHGSIDLFVNFISFQEMEPHIVKNYISHVQRLSPKWVLLRNMREGKQLATDNVVGVKKQITTENYLEYFSDYELVKSSVLEYGFETVDGFSSELMVLKKKIFNWKFMNKRKSLPYGYQDIEQDDVDAVYVH